MAGAGPAAAPVAATASATRSLVALFAATGVELTSIFVFGPLLLIELKARGLGSTAAGAFAALGWIGVLVATPFASRLVRRLGTARALLVSGGVPVLTITGIQLSDSVPLWALLNTISGMAGALRWVLSEALVAKLAPPHRRGRLMGWFSTMIGGTFMLGPALLAAVLARGWTPHQAGWLALGLAVLGLLLLAGVRAPELAAAPAATAGDTAPKAGLGLALRAAPVVMVTGLVGGFFEAGLSGALPLWGLALGWTEAAAALLVTVSGLGSTLAAAPVGELADRWPRERLRRIGVALCLGGALLVPAVSAGGLGGGGTWAWLIWPIVALWGAAGAGLYTLAMTEIGHQYADGAAHDQAPGGGLVDATAVLVTAYTLGGVLAPAVAGLMLDLAPRWGLAAALAVVALVGFWRPSVARR
ncbi:MAG: MFS transporter [Pseudacidovorax sp.]|uniref:MFS transporter n=1 Tax=Pseudacidovorax sp. TaxID=1934311 RepID=UPI001B614ADE|nr:MFS transporter [Pseudacidovorax sp.]MBP6898320.1 MFS transporter [Pseudacidovorax sp.]MBP6901055.1 MFS transporter [Burkholderiaceae bacterium]